jgi:hypothetical protein
VPRAHAGNQDEQGGVSNLEVRCWKLGFRELKKINEALDLPRQGFEDG